MIFIYDDGVHNNAALVTAIQNARPHDVVRYCGATDVINGCLDDAKLLVMPGGADLYFCEKLNGVGNQNIKRFVSKGGSYLGICAGAYYACASLDWNNGEISGARELAFYNGQAIGPVYDWIESKNGIYDGSWMHAAPIMTNDNKEFLTCYNGGPIFTEPKTGDVTVIARYTSLPDSPPAIIQGQHVNGQFILSSSHIELFGDALNNGLYKHMNKSFEHDANKTNKATKYESQQRQFFETAINTLIHHA